MFTTFLCPDDNPLLPIQLVLPRLVLYAQLLNESSLSQGCTAAHEGRLAHGPMCLQVLGSCVQALVPKLQGGPPRRLPVATRLALANRVALSTPAPPLAFALMYRAAPNETYPSMQAAWEVWLADRAPEFRLATTALAPDIAVLWLPSDGPARAWLRTGDAWAAVQGRKGLAQWLPIQHLALPGAYMLNTRRDCTEPKVQVLQTDVPTNADPSTDATQRYSRQAGALSARVLQRLQRSLWVVVGCDTTGSMLAHSLARMGVNLLVLDPASMSAQSMDGDLPPLHEGHAKSLALKHMLRNMLRPGSRCDAKALSVAIPAVGGLLATADGLVCCSSNPNARLWTSAWAQALLKPLLAVRTRSRGAGLEADLQVLPPGSSCLICSGGALADEPWSSTEPSPTPRSWQGMAVHFTLRMLERLYIGNHVAPLARRIVQSAGGELFVQDHRVPDSARLQCPICQTLAGAGLAAVQGAMHAPLAGGAISRSLT